MSKIAIETHGAPSPGGSYSQGFTAGGFVFTAGQGPFDPATGKIVGSTIEEQTIRALNNIKAVLAAGGLGCDDVVKVTAHLADLDRDFEGFDRAYREFFATPFPARTTVGSQLDGILIELDVVAYAAEGL